MKSHLLKKEVGSKEGSNPYLSMKNKFLKIKNAIIWATIVGYIIAKLGKGITMNIEITNFKMLLQIP